MQVFKNHNDISKNMAACGRAQFSLYIFMENCKDLFLKDS